MLEMLAFFREIDWVKPSSSLSLPMTTVVFKIPTTFGRQRVYYTIQMYYVASWADGRAGGG